MPRGLCGRRRGERAPWQSLWSETGVSRIVRAETGSGRTFSKVLKDHLLVFGRLGQPLRSGVTTRLRREPLPAFNKLCLERRLGAAGSCFLSRHAKERGQLLTSKLEIAGLEESLCLRFGERLSERPHRRTSCQLATGTEHGTGLHGITGSVAPTAALLERPRAGRVGVVSPAVGRMPFGSFLRQRGRGSVLREFAKRPRPSRSRPRTTSRGRAPCRRRRGCRP